MGVTDRPIEYSFKLINVTQQKIRKQRTYLLLHYVNKMFGLRNGPIVTS